MRWHGACVAGPGNWRPAIRTPALSAFALALLCAAPAHAAGGGFVLPEPDSLVTLGLGIAGLLIGRRVARKRGDGAQ